MKKRIPSGKDIREMARKLLGEKEREHENDSSHLSRPDSSTRRLMSKAPELQWGRLEKARADSVLIFIFEDSIDDGDEISNLCESLGLEILSIRKVARPRNIDPGKYFKQGNLESFKQQVLSQEPSVLVFDCPFRPTQVRELENYFKKPVLDREGVILSIFKQNAQTHMAKLQVELAELKYLQPRLTGIWEGLSRQRGGAGGMKGRGGGEKQLELDRRNIKSRIQKLNKKLELVEKSHQEQSRKRRSCLSCALVGYTNAGKSTLMKQLSHFSAKSEDKLFSTLDTTVKTMRLEWPDRVLVSDTVGFVRDLPHDLVASFRSTLDEAVKSDVLFHVMDASSPFWREQLESVDDVLKELKAPIERRFFVLNKVDLVKDSPGLLLQMKLQLKNRPHIGIVEVSASEGQGVDVLKKDVLQFFHGYKKTYA